MNKEAAKKSLQSQINKLEDGANHNDQWILQTGSLIERIFGRGSNEYYHFSKFDFSIQYVPGQAKSVNAAILMGKINEIRKFLENCIESVDTLVFESEVKKNILSDLDTKQLLAYIAPVGLAIFGMGFYFGGFDAKNKIDMLESDTKIIRDSLSSVISSRQMPNKGTDTVSTAKNSGIHNKVKIH